MRTATGATVHDDLLARDLVLLSALVSAPVLLTVP
jgi:hypothetical protein